METTSDKWIGPRSFVRTGAGATSAIFGIIGLGGQGKMRQFVSAGSEWFQGKVEEAATAVSNGMTSLFQRIEYFPAEEGVSNGMIFPPRVGIRFELYSLPYK